MTGGASPAGPGVFAAALDWLSAALLGSLATTVAVLAVASMGFLLLAGRVDVRRALQVILGCFILFGASSIAGGIMGAIGGSGPSPEVLAEISTPPVVSPPVLVASPGTPSAFDPYAGAALPARP